MEKIRTVFMGTPEFAVPCLKAPRAEAYTFPGKGLGG